MRYVMLSADDADSGLIDRFDGPIDPSVLPIDGELAQDIRQWNLRYRTIIPLAMEQRSDAGVAAAIRELDADGLRLAARIVESTDGECKVQYYSAGLLEHLWFRGSG